MVPGVEGSSPFTHPTKTGIGSDPSPLYFYTVGRSVTVTHQTLTLILWVRVPPSQPRRRSGHASFRSWAQAKPEPTGSISASQLLLSKTKDELLFLCKTEPYAPVAQQAEHLPFKQGVRGSNPRWSTNEKPAIPRNCRFILCPQTRTNRIN